MCMRIILHVEGVNDLWNTLDLLEQTKQLHLTKRTHKQEPTEFAQQQIRDKGQVHQQGLYW